MTTFRFSFTASRLQLDHRFQSFLDRIQHEAAVKVITMSLFFGELTNGTRFEIQLFSSVFARSKDLFDRPHDVLIEIHRNSNSPCHCCCSRRSADPFLLLAWLALRFTILRLTFFFAFTLLSSLLNLLISIHKIFVLLIQSACSRAQHFYWGNFTGLVEVHLLLCFHLGSNDNSISPTPRISESIGCEMNSNLTRSGCGWRTPLGHLLLF